MRKFVIWSGAERAFVARDANARRLADQRSKIRIEIVAL